MKQYSDTSPGSFKSGGQRIDDHAFFAGSGSPKFPVGNKTKEYSSAEGAGNVGMYEDTTEKVREQQVMGDKKIKAYPRRPLNRN